MDEGFAAGCYVLKPWFLQYRRNELHNESFHRLDGMPEIRDKGFTPPLNGDATHFQPLPAQVAEAGVVMLRDRPQTPLPEPPWEPFPERFRR